MNRNFIYKRANNTTYFRFVFYDNNQFFSCYHNILLILSLLRRIMLGTNRTFTFCLFFNFLFELTQMYLHCTVMNVSINKPCFGFLKDHIFIEISDELYLNM